MNLKKPISTNSTKTAIISATSINERLVSASPSKINSLNMKKIRKRLRGWRALFQKKIILLWHSKRVFQTLKTIKSNCKRKSKNLIVRSDKKSQHTNNSRNRMKLSIRKSKWLKNHSIKNKNNYKNWLPRNRATSTSWWGLMKIVKTWRKDILILRISLKTKYRTYITR